MRYFVNLSLSILNLIFMRSKKTKFVSKPILCKHQEKRRCLMLKLAK